MITYETYIELMQLPNPPSFIFTSDGTLAIHEESGERSASDNVEEEGSPNDPIPDSGSAPSPS